MIRAESRYDELAADRREDFVPDIYERYATAFRFVLDRGYRPIWIEDGFFGGAE